MATSLINVSKHEKKLRKLIQLNQNGATIYTEKTSLALALDVSRSEFIEAFKIDIDRTSKDLIDSIQIINSVQNGIVTEVTTLDNSVEGFFGNCYKDGIITLCGIQFNINKNEKFTKGQVVEYIYNKLFGIDKKELSRLVKALAKYEETKKDIEKALLYPSIVLADKLIESVGVIDKKFNTFRNSMNYEEKQEFDIAFNRSGVTEVIQHSTYIDIKGVRQVASSHKNQKNSIAKLSEGIKNNTFKYIEAVEIDGDGDCNKVLRLVNQIERQLKINCEYKFTLKFRKLGNLNARGVFFSSALIVAEDVRDTSALLHEMAHFIHLSNPQIYTSNFVNYMIDKMRARIDFENLNVTERQKEEFKKKIEYYTNPKEIIARTLEIASLFAFEKGKLILGSDEFDLIKSRGFYEQLEGIYFDFKSFDEDTVEEMLKLYELFYETSYDEVKLTGIDNFYKIDTNYLRVERENEKSFEDLLREEAKKSDKERREKFSFVNANNIDLILKHLPNSVKVTELTKVVLSNIHVCGGYNKSLTAEGWAIAVEDRSTTLIKLIKSVKDTMNEKEYVDFLIEIDNVRLWERTKESILLGAFSYKWKKEIMNCLVDKYSEGFFHQFLNNFRDVILKNSLAAASETLINDLAYIKEHIVLKPRTIRYLCDCEKVTEKSLEKYMLFFIDKFGSEKECLMPRKFFENKNICLYFFTKNPSVKSLHRINKFSNDKEFMKSIIELFDDTKDKETVLEYMDDELKEDNSFMNSIGFGKEEVKEEIVEVSKIEEKINEIKGVQKDNFNKLIESSTIEDFEHTKTGDKLKVMKVTEYISDFKAFNEYLIKNGIAYYSKYAKGFVIKNLEKVAVITAGVSLYSNETLATFANGTLF